MLIPGPIDPGLRRWMVFVDGENLTLGAQRLAEREGLNMVEGRYYLRDVFVWLPDTPPRQYFGGGSPEAGHQRWAARANYYTSVVGDEPKITSIRSRLRQLDFDPHVFKKDARQSRSKAVDIMLTRDMLSGAFLGTYDAAVLIAGDGDYLPIIEEGKRLGKRVSAAFFSGGGLGLNQEIPFVCDIFWPLDEDFLIRWKRELGPESARPTQERAVS